MVDNNDGDTDQQNSDEMNQEFAEYMRARNGAEIRIAQQDEQTTTTTTRNSDDGTEIMRDDLQLRDQGGSSSAPSEIAGGSPRDPQENNSRHKAAETSVQQSNIQMMNNAIQSAQLLAGNNIQSSPMDQATCSLIKEAVDKLIRAHQNMLESERSRLRRMQSVESRSVENQGPTACTSSGNLNNFRPNIQRSYRLTPKSNFAVWLDSLKTELTSWELLDLVDPMTARPVGISMNCDIQRKNSVKDIIINHIDEDYHKKILGLTEPMEILKKLRDSRRGEISVTPTSVRTRLCNLRMNKGERVHQFCERFDQIIREHELSDDPQKLTEQEKRAMFYQAVPC